MWLDRKTGALCDTLKNTQIWTGREEQEVCKCHYVGLDNIACCSASNRDQQQMFKESRKNRANPAFDRMEDTSKPLCLRLSFMNWLLFGHVYALSLCSDEFRKLITCFLGKSFCCFMLAA